MDNENNVISLLESYSNELIQLKTGIQEKINSSSHRDLVIFDDIWLLRYLYNSTPQKAIERVFNTMIWRKDSGIEAIAKNVRELKDFRKFPHFEIMNKYVPCDVFYSFTKSNMPCAVERWGQVNPKGLMSALTPEQIMEYCLYEFEFMRMINDDFTRETGNLTRWFIIMDVGGSSWHQIQKGFLSVFGKIGKIMELHYRELMSKVIVVNTSDVFILMWKVVKTFLPKKTQEKAEFVRDPLATLQKYFENESIPNFLGGSGPASVSPETIKIATRFWV
eukprot:c7798_g1_i1.p1 GENE.c7798_g1_i1~~c7798_g1_i1.p1  ORF type:complete len:277 (-),score=89.05 c7798_g1_i1:51-881(-)